MAVGAHTTEACIADPRRKAPREHLVHEGWTVQVYPVVVSLSHVVAIHAGAGPVAPWRLSAPAGRWNACALAYTERMWRHRHFDFD